MDSLSDKMMKSDMKRPRHSSTEQWHKVLFCVGFKRDSVSLLMFCFHNYVKVKIDKTQQYSKFRLCGNRDKMINYIINECSNFAQKESRLDMTGGESDLLRIMQETEIWL